MRKSLPFRFWMGLALPVGQAQSWLAGQVRAILREDPIHYAWLSSLLVFMLWVPLRFLFLLLFWLALNVTAEGRLHRHSTSA